ncbi:hypothetical protein ABZT00_41450, partial [Streptomyces sp. NPDC005486]
MSLARNHGGDHCPTRLFRSFRHRVAGPLLPVLILLVIMLVGLFGQAGMIWLPLLAANWATSLGCCVRLEALSIREPRY